MDIMICIGNENNRKQRKNVAVGAVVKNDAFWIGLLLRMNNQQNPRTALTLAPEGRGQEGDRDLRWNKEELWKERARRWVSPPGVKLLPLQETQRVGGDKSMALFSQRK